MSPRPRSFEDLVSSRAWMQYALMRLIKGTLVVVLGWVLAFGYMAMKSPKESATVNLEHEFEEGIRYYREGMLDDSVTWKLGENSFKKRDEFVVTEYDFNNWMKTRFIERVNWWSLGKMSVWLEDPRMVIQQGIVQMQLKAELNLDRLSFPGLVTIDGEFVEHEGVIDFRVDKLWWGSARLHKELYGVETWGNIKGALDLFVSNKAAKTGYELWSELSEVTVVNRQLRFTYGK